MRLQILLKSLKILTCSLFLWGGSCQIAMASDDDHVVIGGSITIEDDDTGDVVALGGQIDIGGNIGGDMVAIGGQVDIDVHSEGEIVAIGGQVTVEGITTSSAVVFGGDLDVGLIVGDELVVAGGQVSIDPETNVAGEARIFGGDVSVDGVYSGNVKTGGGSITLNGHFSDTVEIGGYDVEVDGFFGGDVIIEVEDLEFGDSVQFLGDLTIRSPNEPEIPDGLTVGGSYTYEKISRTEISFGDAEMYEMAMIFGFGAVAVLILSLLFLIIALFIVAGGSKVSARGVQMIRHETLRSFLIGLGVVFLAPIVLGLMTALFPPIAVLFAVYVMWLTVGFVMTGYALMVVLANKGDGNMGGGKRFLFAFLGWLILFVLTLIPIIGIIVCVLAMIFGSGAYLNALFDRSGGEIQSTGDEG